MGDKQLFKIQDFANCSLHWSVPETSKLKIQKHIHSSAPAITISCLVKLTAKFQVPIRWK